MGDVVLRRRLEPTTQIDVFEVMLGGDGLMSSLFTDGEEALARLGLDAVTNDTIDVVVGGLGLSYTARTALHDPRVRSLHVVDTLEAVIDWHRQHLIPLGAELTNDPPPPILRPSAPGQYDAILVDIDHSPRHLLDPSHAGLYTPTGLRRLGQHLRPHGVFALWSNDPPDADFLADLQACFDHAEAHIVSFWNFLIGDNTHSTIYVAEGPPP